MHPQNAVLISFVSPFFPQHTSFLGCCCVVLCLCVCVRAVKTAFHVYTVIHSLYFYDLTVQKRVRAH